MKHVIDHRSWDAHEHDSRILPDGSIAVGVGELLDLKARLRTVQAAPTELPEIEWETQQMAEKGVEGVATN